MYYTYYSPIHGCVGARFIPTSFSRYSLSFFFFFFFRRQRFTSTCQGEQRQLSCSFIFACEWGSRGRRGGKYEKMSSARVYKRAKRGAGIPTVGARRPLLRQKELRTVLWNICAACCRSFSFFSSSFHSQILTAACAHVRTVCVFILRCARHERITVSAP